MSESCHWRRSQFDEGKIGNCVYCMRESFEVSLLFQIRIESTDDLTPIRIVVNSLEDISRDSVQPLSDPPFE